MEPRPLDNDEINGVAVLRYPSPAARLALVSILMGTRENVFCHIHNDVLEAVSTIINDPIRSESLRYGDTKTIIESTCVQCMSSRVAAHAASLLAIQAIPEARKFISDVVYVAPEVYYPHHWEISSDGVAVMINSSGCPVFRVTLGTTIGAIYDKVSLMGRLADVPVVYSGKPYSLDVPEKRTVKKMTDKRVALHILPRIPIRTTDQGSLATLLKYLDRALSSHGITASAWQPGEKVDLQVGISYACTDFVGHHDKRDDTTARSIARIMEEQGFSEFQIEVKEKVTEPIIHVLLKGGSNDVFEVDAQSRRVSTQLAKAIADVLK